MMDTILTSIKITLLTKPCLILIIINCSTALPRTSESIYFLKLKPMILGAFELYLENSIHVLIIFPPLLVGRLLK